MAIYCLSDLHLHDDDQPYLFTAEKEGVFAALADEVLETDSQLVLGGDVFDLTGMTPPEGLDDFFSAVLSRGDAMSAEIRAAGRRRSVGEMMAAVRARFPLFFGRLGLLAQAGRLTVVPGNHDHQLGGVEGQQALMRMLGVSELPFVDCYRAGSLLWLTHGHQFDDSNRVDGGVSRGAAITMSLYRGVQPALAALGMEERALRALPAVRPEENLVNGVELHIGAEPAMRVLLGFTRLLLRNGYFRGLEQAKVALASRLAPGFINAARVRAALIDDTDVAGPARLGGEAMLAGQLLALPGEPPPRLVAMGHTHELDGTGRYVNLGTWIDSVRGLSSADLDAVDRRLPVLRVVDSEDAALHDARSLLALGSLQACPELWRTRGELPPLEGQRASR